MSEFGYTLDKDSILHGIGDARRGLKLVLQDIDQSDLTLPMQAAKKAANDLKVTFEVVGTPILGAGIGIFAGYYGSVFEEMLHINNPIAFYAPVVAGGILGGWALSSFYLSTTVEAARGREQRHAKSK